MYPFQTLISDPPLELEGVGSIPRFGCLTLNEWFSLNAVLPQALTLQTNNPIAHLLIDRHLCLILTTILLVSRDDPGWTLDLVNELPLEQLRAAAEFFLNEKDRWGESAKDDGDDRPTKETDWSAIFWRLHGAFPGYFSADRFANLPLAVIESAVDSLNERELQQLNAMALPIAQHGMSLLTAQGFKDPQPSWINPYGRILEKREARSTIPVEVARCFLELCKAKRVPAWVVEVVEVDRFRLVVGD